jgi:hypothetical protein
MERRSHASAALFVMVVTAIPNLFGGLLPDRSTLAMAATPAEIEELRRHLRRGEAEATGTAVAVGVAASLLAGEAWPLLGALAMSGYLIGQYESAARRGEQHLAARGGNG